MITRKGGYLSLRDGPVPPESQSLQTHGYAVLDRVFDAAEVAALAGEIEQVYATWPADHRNDRISADEADDFRYEMVNRSALAQRAVAHESILAVVEPLLGEDCHLIANTCWRNPPRNDHRHGGGFWHIDAGPHVPRPPDVPWDERIPYPVFAIGCHIFLMDCPSGCGPTGVIPGSHKSGRHPPLDSLTDPALTFDGEGVRLLTARAGDVALFVSDVWHRRMPTGAGDLGRFFLQAHYGRRDLAQRLRTTADANQLSACAIRRAGTTRQRQLIGLHKPFFYDG